MRLPLAAALLVSLSACNQSAPDKKPEAATSTESLTIAQKAYAKVNDDMHKGMAAIAEDADVAFMQGMIAHHKGAIDMSQVVLEHGKDAKTRAMAETIIKAQTSEIAEMEAWLKERDIAPAAAVDHAAMGH
jgi:uncharacterized protein (DUF305 family)